MGILVISFDAVGDKVFEKMAGSGDYPNITSFYNEATYCGGIKSIFVSNTYPIHTTISTGKLPKDHGVIANTLPLTKSGDRPWVQFASMIKAKTLWDAAKEKGLKTASLLWPVTCKAKIDYNMPEVHLLKGQNRIIRHLMYGSKFFQIKAMLKHRHLLKNMKDIEKSQPQLDNFTTAIGVDLLKEKKPDLALVHLIAYDHICHHTGLDSSEIKEAKKALDDNLGRLLGAWHGTVLVFSDHSQLPVHENINLCDLYKEDFLQLGGCAFFQKPLAEISEQHWFGRYLTKEEMSSSGHDSRYDFGIAAKPGFNFSDGENIFKGDHGYPVDYENYNTFYAINKEIDYAHKLKGSVRDVTAIIAKELGLDMDIIAEYGL
ncbi:MAG: ectonucleotide pyrophosphatase/phosphodiesterase [Defluviitaleaceae bacterium]|nr:ectonucleotide pyrophosphatase/phosphodiesterase [Defluviitaleaceae bacterium]